MCLDSCRPQATPLPPALTVVQTVLVAPAWATALQTHQDRAFVRYIIDGLSNAFRIGFNRATHLQSASSNMGSAQLHPHIITDYIRKELSRGRMLGPFPPSFSAPELHINRFGVIPKGHNTGKWHLSQIYPFPQLGV